MLMTTSSTDLSSLLINITDEDLVIAAHGPIFDGPGAVKHSNPFVLRKLASHQRNAIERAKQYAMDQNIKEALVKQTQLQQNLQFNIAKRNQTLNLLNRVYIGSIAYDVQEELIKQLFLPFGPVKTVSMSWDQTTHKHKGFAFVDFELPEAAQLAIEQMNGSNFEGRLIKVGRPSNFPDASPFINELIKEFKLQKRIYIAGIHPDLTDVDVSLVFESFGKIKMCRLAQDPARLCPHRGFGYIEFETIKAANDSVISMNKFDLGGQLLRVTKAISPSEGIPITTISHLPTASAVAAASVTAKLLSLNAEQLPIARPLVPVLPSFSATPSPPLSQLLSQSLSEHFKNSIVNSSTQKIAQFTKSTEPQKKSDQSSLPPIVTEKELSPEPKTKWAKVEVEEELSQQTFVRSNDSRLYSVQSPSSIPLPPSTASA